MYMPSRSPLIRRLLLCSLALLSLTYAIAVLGYVYTVPDIGLRSAFDTTVRRFDGKCEKGESLSVRDRIVKLGGSDTATWQNLLQGLNALGTQQPLQIGSLDQAEEQYLNEAKSEKKTTYVETLGTKYVRVEFARVQGGHDTILACWCAVDRLPAGELIPSILWFFLKVGLFTVGFLVFWKRPNDASATQFFLLCIVTLAAYIGGYHWSHIVRSPTLIVGFILCSVLLPAVLLHFNALFPRPIPVLVRYRWRTLPAIYGPPAGFLIAIIGGYFYVRALAGFPADRVNGAIANLRLVIYIYLVVAALWYVASIFFLIYSYRAATDTTERNQVKWILYGSLGALVPIVISLHLAVFEPDLFSAGWATWPMFAASVCFTAAFIISITRYRLMQLDQILSSSMIYFFISFLFGLIYYAVVSLGTLFVASRQWSQLSQALTVSTTALLLMIVLDRARSRFKKALDRRFYREKNQLDRTLRSMSQAIDQLVDPQRLARQLLQASTEVLAVARGAVYLRDGTPAIYKLVESLGTAPPLQELSSGCPVVEPLLTRGAALASGGRVTLADPVTRQLRFLGADVAQAITHEGELLGLLFLGPKESGSYSAEDLNLLAAFSQLTALALKSAERHRTIESLNRELQTKVEKISEQQRRIIALQTQLTRQTTPQEVIDQDSSIDAPGGIVGTSAGVHNVMQLVKKASASRSAVLVRGESGTGKELLARALHDNSPRAAKPYVKVHCAALSPTLLESELFGHVKGAFTDAHKDKVGRFELADGGTLFLDEIGDISLEVQTKLLRVLQEMTFERVGSSESVHVDVRVIAATHQNLERLIAEGRFREDLYYRINVISISVPPLRERREDIPELVQHFLKLHAERCGKPVLQVEDDALAILKAYAWPGNIRQLENVIERAVVIAEGSEITPAELPGDLIEAFETARTPTKKHANGIATDVSGLNGLDDEHRARDQHERERLVRALASADGNKAEAARALGLARSTLVSRLKKHGLS